MDSSLLTLARYMSGEFDNREQAIAEPIWYVHLRLWQRPVPLFTEDSLTLFAEQANILQSGQPYRQRLLRLRQVANEPESPLQVQYYSFKDPGAISGAGSQPEILQTITLDQIDRLPGCVLHVTQPTAHAFVASPPPDSPCYFTYQGETRQVSLGFEARSEQFLSYDKGVDIETGKALWGAIMGPYRYTKRQDFADELREKGE
ncbi:chromophore lyase CpcT/CpeT [Kovacikia minuta CCNUW1]|uniref:chromophore lyase CpcT/CpeT n=1 Tax=Kovacikia minuta TaxID=2931930 RepID=UPI001CD03A67|nr:chromophore lyase CpcT/CpeT [Kovacikia minuta]UBF26816.1 chromophore lyase CpcT/CpeT [Kovacikia minuta CCNUW1]